MGIAKWMALLVSLTLFLVSACQPAAPRPTQTPEPSPTPPSTATPVPEDVIVVDTSVVQQVVQDVAGGNFIHKFSGMRRFWTLSVH